MKIKWKRNYEMNDAVSVMLIIASTSILGATSMQFAFAQPSDQQPSMNTMSGTDDTMMMMDMKMNTTEGMTQTMMMQMMNMMDKMNKMNKMMDMMMMDMPMAGDNSTGSMQNQTGNMMG